VMAGQRGDQAKAPAPRVMLRAHRGTSTDTSSDERPLAVTHPRADCRGVMSLVSE
jgi:hypothetical protein